MRNGCALVSGIALGPNFASRRRASSPVKPSFETTLAADPAYVVSPGGNGELGASFVFASVAGAASGAVGGAPLVFITHCPSRGAPGGVGTSAITAKAASCARQQTFPNQPDASDAWAFGPRAAIHAGGRPGNVSARNEASDGRSGRNVEKEHLHAGAPASESTQRGRTTQRRPVYQSSRSSSPHPGRAPAGANPLTASAPALFSVDLFPAFPRQ
jgi:hypothetical protein